MTYENLLSRRGWTGRTSIDPNHSLRVEGDRYLSSHTPAQRDAIEAIIEDSQADILRRALPPTVLGRDAAAELADSLPDTLAAMNLNEDGIAQLLSGVLSGQQDVFTATCADVMSGLHGPKGAPCPARPWVCLLCPLAVFLPRHAPNLLRLKAFFARQFRAMTTEQFLAVFGPYSHRLNEEILPRYTPGTLTAAAAQVLTGPTALALRPEEVA